MGRIFQTTFGGLTPSYYFRHMFFSFLIGACFIYGSLHQVPVPYEFIAFSVVTSLFYPYARFVYENIVRFILGENIFFLHISIVLFFKVLTMLICWMFALAIAPIGLAYLYYHNNRHPGAPG